jgi:hypothetical protein
LAQAVYAARERERREPATEREASAAVRPPAGAAPECGAAPVRDAGFHLNAVSHARAWADPASKLLAVSRVARPEALPGAPEFQGSAGGSAPRASVHAPGHSGAVRDGWASRAGLEAARREPGWGGPEWPVRRQRAGLPARSVGAAAPGALGVPGADPGPDAAPQELLLTGPHGERAAPRALRLPVRRPGRPAAGAGRRLLPRHPDGPDGAAGREEPVRPVPAVSGALAAGAGVGRLAGPGPG